MTPENGKFTWISTITLTTSNQSIPAGTTHIVVGLLAGTLQEEYGILGIKFDGTTLCKVPLPCGEFIALGNIIPVTTKVLIETVINPASTITGVTCYRWEQS